MFIPILYCLLIALGILTSYKYIQLLKLEQENTLMASYMETMQKFYTVITQRAETVRRYRHDLSKHIRTLQLLSDEPQASPDLKVYMGNLSDTYEQLTSDEYCSDEIVSSVLTIKKQQCMRLNIPFEIHIEDQTYSAISEFDMVSLLHNLLDNAIEANQLIPGADNRGIEFSMGRNDSTIWIALKNHVLPNSEITFETHKVKKENHGFGTKIIQSIIKKYQGLYETSLDRKNALFIQQIQFPVEPATTEE